MKDEVLSPLGNVDPIKQIVPNPRVADLNQATIGLYTTFKEHWVLILREIAKQLKERYPGVRFTEFQYPKDLNAHTAVAELAKDAEVRPRFEEWIAGVDAVIVAHADAGSCTLYLTYNATFPEHLGKPTVMTVAHDFFALAKRAAGLRGVPALRCVELDLLDLAREQDLEFWADVVIPQRVAKALDGIIAGLTQPLTPEEATVPANPMDHARIAMTGTVEEVNREFYRNGWSYGMPIMPPTEEAVREMLTGTDLSPDHVVAKLPPLNGKATVEKVAVNAVMAGCLPTHLPVVLAGVEAMADPRMWLEGYTTSLASWAPLMTVNGPVRHDLRLNSGPALLSPYRRGNAAIAHAIGLTIMNIAGIKEGREDTARFGHEGRFGMCFAENEEASPWEPLHVYYGFKPEESAITVSWPNNRLWVGFSKNIGAVMKGLCDHCPAFGFDPGCTIILTPELAKFLHSEGYSRKKVADYIVEYARVPAGATSHGARWMVGNHHEPTTVSLPADPTRWMRKFWSDEHLLVIVAGGPSMAAAFYDGGGDHGGPITKKIKLPSNWNELVARYGAYEPDRQEEEG